MGTNYYLTDKTHIGKESAGGMYCWDCKITLCESGSIGIHYGASKWHKKCPKCKKGVNETSPNAMFKQLGFTDKKDTPIKKGVTSISTFTWATDPKRLKRIRKIINEYGRILTKKEFVNMLVNWAPIHYYDNIGNEFS